MPQVADYLGVKSRHAISWVDAMSKCLVVRDDVELAIVVPAKKPRQFKIDIDGIIFYVVSEKNNKKEWDNIISEFRPNIIHVYGTEKGHNLSLIEFIKDIPIVISLQGLLTEYERFYYGGIDVSVLSRYFTLRDIVFGSVFVQRKRFQRNALREQYMLNNVNFVEGRTDWDRVASVTINPGLKYYHCPRMIRNIFYTHPQWSYDEMEAHSIFVTQGDYPIKGLHFMLQALALLKKKYSDVKLYIAGHDLLYGKTLKQKLKTTGYSKYLKSLIKKYQLDESISFTGYLSANEVAEKLAHCNVMVIPSVIENAPNALAEAELLGVPCVASFVGGNPEMLKDGEEGFLYCYNEPGMLADKISKIFESRELAEYFSNNARATAMIRHDPETLENTLMGIYKDIICNFPQ